MTADIFAAKILIVDDQLPNVRLLESILKRWGYVNYQGLTDSRQVVPRFLEWHPDLLLLDLMMPHLDGFAVMQQLITHIPPGHYFPILVLTADITPEAKQRALSSGAKDFLTKPLDAIEVGLRIKNLLETRYLYLELQEQNQQLSETRAQLNDLLHRFVPSAVADRLIATPQEARPGGERREVSVLFADLRGFTHWSEHQTPEDVFEVLNQRLAIGAEAVLAEGGTLDKFMGDALMAIFNAPQNQPDHAYRALRAAYRMLSRLADDALGLNFGVGINSGEALAGNLGVEQALNYTVIGDVVNQAKRIQELARRGQILFSQATYEQAQQWLTARSLGPQHLRGREQPVEVYELRELTVSP